MKGNLYITNGNFGKYTIHRKLYNTNGELYKDNKENTCTIQIEKKIHSADTIHMDEQILQRLTSLKNHIYQQTH